MFIFSQRKNRITIQVRYYKMYKISNEKNAEEIDLMYEQNKTASLLFNFASKVSDLWPDPKH